MQSIKRLRNDGTCGHDGLPGFVVRDCAPVLAGPLAFIFNLILRTSQFPDMWKISRITPVFKSGQNGEVSNYRPINILSNVSKVLEQLLHKEIFRNVRCLISSNQHGFISGRSTVTNLVTITQFLSDAMDRNEQVDVIYTDFSKAFDVIDHSILLKKLDSFGFSTALLKLIQSYLLDRKCYVYYNGYSSKVFKASSGVPQGSNLGPLFFNIYIYIYINDLLPTLRCHALAYADDLKIYCKINSNSDCTELQRNFESVQKWCNGNDIHLNANKCAIVSYTKSSDPITYNYHIDQTPIQRKTQHSDLGVLFDCKLQFSAHIERMCRAATRSMGFVMRSCHGFQNLDTLKTLYYTFIRSKLEYASIIWYPYYLNLQLSIERIQRKFLKYLVFKASGTYPGRGIDYKYLLNLNGFVSLSERRESHSANFLCKLITNKIDSPELVSCIKLCVPVYRTRSTNIFYVPTARTNVLLKAPFIHMAKNGNRLLEDPFA